MNSATRSAPASPTASQPCTRLLLLVGRWLLRLGSTSLLSFENSTTRGIPGIRLPPTAHGNQPKAQLGPHEGADSSIATGGQLSVAVAGTTGTRAAPESGRDRQLVQPLGGAVLVTAHLGSYGR